MHTRLLLISLLLWTSTSATSQDKIHLKVDAKGLSKFTTNISVPVDGHFFIGNWHEATFDASGSLIAEVSCDGPGVYQLWLNYMHWRGRLNAISFYAEPGDTINLSFMKDDEWNTIEFKGDHREVNERINRREQYMVDQFGQSEYMRELMQTFTAKDFKSFFEEGIANADTFYWEDTRYYYAYLTMAAVGWVERGVATVKDSSDWIDLKTHVLETVPLANDEALGSYWYNEYLRVSWPTYHPEIVKKASNVKRDKIDSLMIAIYREMYSGETEEHQIASYIRSKWLKNQFGENIPDLVEEFKRNYPDSPYLLMLEQCVIGSMVANDLVISIDTEMAPKSIDALRAKFPGKKLWVNLWATWCGPCKKEFKEIDDSMRIALSKQNIEMVFISVDDPVNGDMCEKIINYHKLTGYHLLAGESIKQELYDLVNGGEPLPLPSYVMIDENGQVMLDIGMRPSLWRERR